MALNLLTRALRRGRRSTEQFPAFLHQQRWGLLSINWPDEAQGLLDRALPEMRTWAKDHDLTGHPDAVILTGTFRLDDAFRLVLDLGLPDGWTMLASSGADAEMRFFVARTRAGTFVLLAIDEDAMDGSVVRPLVCEPTLGAFVEKVTDTIVAGPLLTALRSLVAQCHIDEDEQAEQVMFALSGGVYAPRSSHVADLVIAPLDEGPLPAT